MSKRFKCPVCSGKKSTSERPKTIEEVNNFIQDDSWVAEAIKELEEEFSKIEQEEAE